MAVKIGDLIAHPKKAEWGNGEVLAVEGTHVRVYFSNIGEKTIDEQFVSLERVGAVDPNRARTVAALPTIDLERVKRLCELFIQDLKDNRSHYNDSSLAENIAKDLQRFGRPSRSTARQLAAWCTTNGSVFQKGVPIAQDLSMAIYGRVLRRQDVDDLE